MVKITDRHVQVGLGLLTLLLKRGKAKRVLLALQELAAVYWEIRAVAAAVEKAASEPVVQPLELSASQVVAIATLLRKVDGLLESAKKKLD